MRVPLSSISFSGGVQINKYVRAGLSFIVWIIGLLLAFSDYIDWNKLVGVQTAGTVIGVIGAIKFGYALLAPKPSVGTVPTGNVLVTQQAAPAVPPAPPPAPVVPVIVSPAPPPPASPPAATPPVGG